MPVFSGYIGLLFLGAAFISAGLFISTTTENQIIAAIGGFALSLLLWVIGWGANYVGPTLGPVFNYLSIINHFEDFAQGVIDTSCLLYFICICGPVFFHKDDRIGQMAGLTGLND